VPIGAKSGLTGIRDVSRSRIHASLWLGATASCWLLGVVVAVSIAWAEPRILVHPSDALVDTPIRIRFEEFPPRQPVTAIATAHALDGTKWQSRAVFVSDSLGNVDVSTTAPESGYEGVSPMGLFWAMERLPGERTTPPPESVMQPWRVDFEALAPGGSHAKAAVMRRLAAPGVTRHVIREGGVIGTLFLSPGTGRRPAIIVLGGSSGGVWEARAALLASHGYAALALGYFRMPGLPQGLVNIPLEYFETAIRWMRAQDWLSDDFLAVIGSSRGGELALLLGATFPDINAVIAVVPSGVLHGPFGPGEPGDARRRATWTLRGSPLPYLQENNRTGNPSAVERRGADLVETPLYLAWLRDTAAVERSSIRVEQIKGPVLLISGRDDAIWPSFAMAEVARRRLEAHRHPFPFLHLAYDAAGHSIFAPYAPTTESTSMTHPVNGKRYALGGSPRANADAGADSWPRILRFLEDARRNR
jgi:dienelactone hydrolase